jgi:hypothetical protein
MSRNNGTNPLLSLIIILLFLLFAGGIGAFFQGIEAAAAGFGLGIWSIFSSFPHLPTSIYDLVKDGITSGITLTSIEWLNTLLINIATIAPSIFIFLIGKLGLKLNITASSIISIFVLIAVLELFSSLVFWIILGVIIISSITFSIIFYLKNNENGGF